jgi:DNA helicase HerA-like ATPase
MQLGLIRQFDPHRREEYFTPLDISDERRLQHLFVIGRTGTGKSTALKNFILQDMHRGLAAPFSIPTAMIRNSCCRSSRRNGNGM